MLTEVIEELKTANKTLEKTSGEVGQPEERVQAFEGRIDGGSTAKTHRTQAPLPARTLSVDSSSEPKTTTVPVKKRVKHARER